MEQVAGSGLALEYDLMKQQKYRVYISNIDKALKNFEGSCSEWADLISALGKLNKVISSYPQYDIIPRRIKISKRLAQCMHPNLPSGVHLKALETYGIIFQNAGVERLASELFIYSAGLFPLFGYAAMNVRPALLDIYEKHFVPLGERLRPALSGFLSGVLPGLEVGMDHFSRTNMLLEQVCAAVSPSYFYTCVWECVATNSAIRLPAVSYVLEHFSRKLAMQDQRYILGENVDLTVSALCACLNDPVILVQRNTLEFLLIGFPMHDSVLADVDTVKLVTHGLNTILRRDMSLNRRLYSWLLGTEVKQRTITSGSDSSATDPHSDYFSHYSMRLLIRAYNTMLKLSLSSNPVDLRPYKILISLLDKVEIGPVILDEVLFNVIRTMFLSRNNQEVQKQANLLFSTFDASYIWDFMTNVYGKTCITASDQKPNLTEMLDREVNIEVDSGPPSLKEVCRLTEFLLETVSLEMYNETTRIYLPRVLLAITKMLTIYSESLLDDEVTASLNLMQKIVTRVQPMITGPSKPVERLERDQNREEKVMLEKSKSDSKINLLEDDITLKKSASQSKIPKSPKKSTKKSKSYSKLQELDKDIICSDSGQLVSSTPHIDETSATVNETEQPTQRELTMPEYSILEKCIKQYEIFFQVYVASKVFRIENRSGVTVRVLTAQESIEKSKFLNEELVMEENPNRTDAIETIFGTLELESECRIAKLKDLLNACISDAQKSDAKTGERYLKRRKGGQKEPSRVFIGQLLNHRLSEPFKTTLKLSCNLLVDMSTFPNYNQGGLSDLEIEDLELPHWLKCLSAIACYLNGDRDLQISVISILFELISLLKLAGKPAPGVTAVIMLPLMERGHLSFMSHRTRIFQILVSTLWDYLGDIGVNNVSVTRLLYQLHNSLGSGIVEQVIGHRLANSHLIWSTSLLDEIRANPRGNESLVAYTDTRLHDLVISKPIVPTNGRTSHLTEKQGEGFRKFELLWHLAPSQETESGFEKTQLRMYDSLSLPLPIRAMVIKWLQDALLKGDIGNILKPLLKVLLALRTRRISLIQVASKNEEVTDAKLEKTLQQYDILTEKELFTVSSEPTSSGVRYRTEAISKKKSPRGLRIFGVPLNPIKSKTPSLENVKKLMPKVTPEDPNMSLIVNPLETSSDLEVDEFGVPLSSSAPTPDPQSNLDYLESASTGELSRKKVSGNGNMSDSGSLSSESEIGELPQYSSLPETTKRFSGNCEHVDEKMTAFDKIKNRKTYKLTKTDEVSLNRDDDDKSLAEMSIRIRQTELDDITLTESSKDEGIFSLPKEESDGHKRLSCSSKESTSSSSAYSGSSQNRGSSVEPSAGLLEEEETQSMDDELIANMNPDVKIDMKSKTPEARRRGNVTTEMNWEKTKEKFEKSKLNLEILRQNLIEENLKLDKIDPYHTHILLYLSSYDTKQTLYAFETIRHIIAVDTRMFVCMSLTTSVSTHVRHLLERHRRSIDGRDSLDCDTSVNCKKTHESQYSYRGCMYLESLVTLCLYYSRSYFQRDILGKSGKDSLTSEEISDNFKIQIEAVNLLTLLLNELISVVKEMGKALNMSSYVADLMNKCRVPKIVLHSLMTSVNAITKTAHSKTAQFVLNDSGDESLFVEAIQLQLLKLLNTVIKLEFEVRAQLNDDSFKEIIQASPTKLLVNVPTNAKYLPGYTIPQQPMFMAAIITALQSDQLKHLHKNWTSTITNCLHCCTGGSLTNIVINVVHQICNNIDKLIHGATFLTIPVDYAAAQMEALTTLCHYCLLDSNHSALLNSQTSFSQSLQQVTGNQMLNSFMNVLMSASTSSFLAVSKTPNSHHIAARNAVLSHLPRIIGSAAGLWEHELGQTRFVKQQLFDFLNPICLHHTSNFLAALAVAWHERNKSEVRRSSDGNPTIATKYLPQAASDQLILVKLISGIRAMRMELFIRTLHEIIKSAPTIYNPPSGWNLEVSGLELFYFYLTESSATSLLDAWPSLLGLLRDGIGSSSPPALFVLAAILSSYVQRCPQMPFNDRRDLRDLHDMTTKLVDALSLIAGANLEQTTWLRRNLAVKEDNANDSALKDGVAVAQYSVQAQSIMACLLANLLDVAYGSQEKDKVATIVTTVMYNIVPYLKNHTPRNIPSFFACSNLLANLSGYQNTRKAWRKEVFDLLTDSAFFQMDTSCLPFWKTIMDNLMTYDNMATFRDLMNRVSLTQTGGLNIFSSKEQEYEQRAMLLKRLAFVIFCSEFDQYHKYMPEIQEQLANSLRLPQMVPSVQAAVFLCFRVLLLRLSPDHVTSLWPTIIAEMVQVFLAIEQELMTDTEEFRIRNSQHIRMLSALDTQWVTNSNNGLHAQGHPHWRMVQLETAKLLELGCVLPAVNLPHFQMYRWAFVRSQYDWGSPGVVNGDASVSSNSSIFVPHVTRIARLMDLRYTSHSPIQTQQKGQHLVLTCQSINNLQELYGFFSTLSVRWPTQNVLGDQEKEVKVILREVEQVLANDFLELMPQGSTSAR